MQKKKKKEENLFLVNRLVLADKLYKLSPTSKFRLSFLSAPLAIYSCVSATSLGSQQP